MQHLKSYDKYVQITGFRNINFADAEAFLKANRKTQCGVEVQFFEAQLIATQQHLYFAVLNALEAFQNKTNLSKSLAMETMLYASAQRQIQKAIQRCGIKPDTANMAAVVIGDEAARVEAALNEVSKGVGGVLDGAVLELTSLKEDRIRRVFQVSDEELNVVQKNGDVQEALVNSIIERVALLATQL